MSLYSLTAHGKSQINKTAAFCEILEQQLPNPDTPIKELLDHFDLVIQQASPSITKQALSNAHGDWYEWLLAIQAWNYHVETPSSFLAINLPNINQFDVGRLYTDELYNFILDLRQKVTVASAVSLITSNPDFVIIDTANIHLPNHFNEKIITIDQSSILMIQQAYQHVEKKCDFNDIVGFLSVKTSFRSDRRLQIPHEGSLMKALYTHLQTRKWILSPKGLKYYAAATEVGTEDKNALKTVATHSITTVHSIPQAAVDEVFTINSLNQAVAVYRQILHEVEAL